MFQFNPAWKTYAQGCSALLSSYFSPQMGLKLNVQVDSRTINLFDQLHEILVPLKSNVNCAQTPSGPWFSVTHTKCRAHNITDSSSAAEAHTGFDPLFWPTPGHKQEATYRTCVHTSTNNTTYFAPQKHTEIHTLDISTHMYCMTLVLATGLLHWMLRKKNPYILLVLELRCVGKNSTFFQLCA